MSEEIKIYGESLPNIPWEEKPANCDNVVWRSKKNPIIPRDATPNSNSIFNSAVVPYKEGFAGVFRVDDKARNMNIHAGKSKDGINWDIEPEPIEFDYDKDEIGKSEYKYDPRVVAMDGKYYVMWCNGYHGPTIGLGYTEDFKNFTQMENSFLPFNRNGVLFPRKINDKYVMLSRPSDNGHTPFGDIFLSQSNNLVHWGEHRYVMGSKGGWQSTKIGPGPAPIETSEGWLLIYHGVLNSCNGFVYSMGAALLDLEKPWQVKYRTEPYLLSPQEDYECVGDVPNVAFPCATLHDPDTGRMAIYYGGADTVVALAYTKIDELVEFIKNNSL
ncbi:beta-1,4-mannooligosaccharide/beta-1,4-mannosyl-N-acetylglucosamine phosphorylase [Halanaerobium saccharolyticum]|jgi:beta-1,4-mannooligosaccharide/beta-1,4-mannosyl-N-acetylglucosamine phosphorylase|uniref:Beta-1,4-mannooligosaccharide/beta-1, 4-mannosyl-N-acetylglucosamine phosphorylase n=1 Tax=Halanaerobium saccharolyticum TaxID=43595 RepID=A0A2T5RMW8_9FIRM|nr:glycoside hydrolase family 130 protein [Halanaerobium saccharolyticum]PTW00863.1 beta-1,4-mannooligosaccharide/beta-1,4-mannosyl-N-acetylglucosamine phosphorylase [Halanaerobium saccharolyticum]TDP88792.1 beta-1,4-mannooligosaccharide/beta-1,4-mannosyl-N-acetylglucosamine phosphorylase [Halanaerobium saccharolyticum]